MSRRERKTSKIARALIHTPPHVHTRIHILYIFVGKVDLQKQFCPLHLLILFLIFSRRETYRNFCIAWAFLQRPSSNTNLSLALSLSVSLSVSLCLSRATARALPLSLSVSLFYFLSPSLFLFSKAYTPLDLSCTLSVSFSLFSPPRVC